MGVCSSGASDREKRNRHISRRSHFGAMAKPVHRKTKRREMILWIEGYGFSLIIAFAWLTEILHLPHFLFSEPAVMNLNRALARTVVVLCVWFTVNLATRRLLKRLHHLEEFLRICSWCRKIDHDGKWVTMEEYFGSAFTTKTTHGICPECSPVLEKSDGRDKK
jgi:hypothetical protein